VYDDIDDNDGGNEGDYNDDYVKEQEIGEGRWC